MNDWAEFRHFRYLLSILEKRGFRAAAEDLHTSQPNLTVQARQFQENVGVCLFRKSRAGHIRITETGVAFMGLARYLLEVRDEVIEAIRAASRGEITSVCCGSSSLVDQKLFRTLCAMHRDLLPAASIRPTHGDVSQFIEEIQAGIVDIALVTLPLDHPDLLVEEVRRDRLVVCLQKDSPLAQKRALHMEDLQEHLRVFFSPQRHPAAHARLLELLVSAGVEIREYSRASHPSEMQTLVKEGFGMALVREGIDLDDQLTTRPIAGVDWTVDTAIVYHKTRHQKTIPVLVRKFKRKFGRADSPLDSKSASALSKKDQLASNHDASPPNKAPVQLRLLG